jgi:multidrug resistance efflux pump
MAVVAGMGNRSVFPFDEVEIPPSEPGYGFLSPIMAPVDGIASQRSAEIGGRISQGQQLIVVVQIDNVWTTANFKETQLRKMHVGQRVTIEVDSLDESFDGAVEFMPAATRDRSSLFPPENATGNYVKIVQRLAGQECRADRERRIVQPEAYNVLISISFFKSCYSHS